MAASPGRAAAAVLGRGIRKLARRILGDIQASTSLIIRQHFPLPVYVLGCLRLFTCYFLLFVCGGWVALLSRPEVE